MEPIAEIRLPSHHPAVAACKPGDMVHLTAKRLPPHQHMGMVKDVGPEPPPLEHRFHVTSIAAAKAEAKSKESTPLERIKSKPAAKRAASGPLEALRKRRGARPAAAPEGY